MADTFPKASISAELAHRMVAAAEAKADEMGIPFVIAIVDESGVLKAFSRMDGAALLSVQVAQDKAYTAVGFGMPTDGWFDFIKDDGPLSAGATSGDRSPRRVRRRLSHRHRRHTRRRDRCQRRALEPGHGSRPSRTRRRGVADRARNSSGAGSAHRDRVSRPRWAGVEDRAPGPATRSLRRGRPARTRGSVTATSPMRREAPCARGANRCSGARRARTPSAG